MEKLVSCMVCGQRFTTVQESLGHPHFTEGSPARPNDLDAWYRTAKDLDLVVVSAPDGNEIVVFSRDHLDRGYAWIESYRMTKATAFDTDIVDTDPAGMFKHFGHMARGTK